ncbi:ferrochelatase, partial [Amaricoccus sp. HAR-UPW-R2A-40]
MNQLAPLPVPGVPDLPGEGRLTFAPQDHPPVPRAKIGVIVSNLGTPDATDYWSM